MAEDNPPWLWASVACGFEGWPINEPIPILYHSDPGVCVVLNCSRDICRGIEIEGKDTISAANSVDAYNRRMLRCYWHTDTLIQTQPAVTMQQHTHIVQSYMPLGLVT